MSYHGSRRSSSGDPGSIIDNIINNVFNEYLRAKAELDTDWPWPLSAVQDFAEDLYNNVVNIPKKVADRVHDVLEDFFEWIWDNVSSVVYDYFRDVYYTVVDWSWRFDTPWRYIIRPLLLPAAFMYVAYRDHIGPALDNVVQRVGQWFDGAFNAAAETIASVLRPIVDPIRSFVDTVSSFITETLPSWIDATRKFFAEDIPRFITETLPGWFNAMYRFMISLPERIPEFLGTIAEWMWDRIQWLGGLISEKISEVTATIRDWVMRVFDAIGDLFDEVIEAGRRLLGAPRQGDVIAGLLRSLAPLILGAFAATLALDLASIKVAGSGADLDGIKQFISNLMPADKVVSSLINAVVTAGILIPAQYVIWRETRPKILDPSTYVTAYFRGIINETALDDHMALHGIRPDQVPIMVETARPLPNVADAWRWLNKDLIDVDDFIRYARGLGWRENEVRTWMLDLQYDLRLFDLYRIFDTVSTEPQWLVDKLKIYGYSITDIENVALSILRRPFRDDVRNIVRGLIELYEMGLIDDEKFMAELQRLEEESMMTFNVVGWDGLNRVSRTVKGPMFYLTDYEKKALLEYAKFRRERYIIRQKLYALLRALRAGRITRDKFVEEAKALGIPDELIETLIETEAKVYTPSATFLLTLSETLRLDPNWVLEKLDELGVPDDLKPHLLKYAVYKRLDPYIRRVVERYHDEFVNGYISEEEFRERVRALGRPDDEINLLVIAGKAERRVRFKAAARRAIVNAYKKMKISYDEAVTRLVAIGLTEEAARELLNAAKTELDLYAKYDLWKDEASGYITTLRTMYKYGYIDYDTLVQELKAAGKTDQEISWIVKRADMEFEREINKILEDAILTALRKDKITPEQAVEELVGLGMRRERAQALVSKVMAAKKFEG